MKSVKMLLTVLGPVPVWLKDAPRSETPNLPLLHLTDGARPAWRPLPLWRANRRRCRVEPHTVVC